MSDSNVNNTQQFTEDGRGAARIQTRQEQRQDPSSRRFTPLEQPDARGSVDFNNPDSDATESDPATLSAQSAFQPMASAADGDTDDSAGSDEVATKTAQKARSTRVFRSGAALILAGILAFTAWGAFTSGSTRDITPAAQQEVANGTSTSIQPGTVIFSHDDDADAHPFDQDYTVEIDGAAAHQPTTQLYIWDYGGEDGDYVQVFIDGVATGEPFMILHKPATLDVPVNSTVTVVGTRDGGGGITYAVYCEGTQTTYFNGMNVGGDNTFTFTTTSAAAG